MSVQLPLGACAEFFDAITAHLGIDACCGHPVTFYRGAIVLLRMKLLA